MLAVQAAASGSAYTIIWVLVGFITVAGTGGVLGIYKWAKRQGVRDSQLDSVIHVVLGEGNQPGISEMMAKQVRELAELRREARPNGGTSQHLGDVVQRTETKVDKLTTAMDQHIGKSDAIHEEFRRRMEAVERGNRA